ncbi:MAG: excinuclease ABC subunit UvrA [Gammaproteobacteria bacterium]|nr:excinuclease ABC subunit UvrA [Gammaproteobacteria bacterium]
MSDDCIRVHGARQHNLKNLDLDVPLNELIVVTGVSGSGKSSLAFDTLYAEGQRRYVETFSPYARQFLDRQDRPAVDRIEGIPPAIAIDQVNPVRSSRSTVGTMTELNDHLKLLFARAARLYCRNCGREVRRDTAESVASALLADRAFAGQRALITFGIRVPANFSTREVEALLAAQGYTHIHRRTGRDIEVVQDRPRIADDNRARLAEALEAAFHRGRGRLSVYALGADKRPGAARRFSDSLHCADCDIEYSEPRPNLFSFNSPLGACSACRGFGRLLGIDWGLVIPDESKTLAGGAVKPWQTPSYRDCQRDLVRYAKKRGVPLDVPWQELAGKHRRWVIEGEGSWEERKWYGATRFFKWLESKSYKMHIRVLLSKYRAYTTCPDCAGARLRPEALYFRVGTRAEADRVLPPAERFKPNTVTQAEAAYRELPGLNIADIQRLPVTRVRGFFDTLKLPAPHDAAAAQLLEGVHARLRYLTDVGLGYLTLDRQSRTLSGGEVQRINLTTALGTSLTNTLFVLDEPSIGLHPRDIGRVTGILQRLRDAGNTLVVVEHDPQIMLAADRILDLGPGPGERGGEIVFWGRTAELAKARGSLTADYLSGRKKVSTRRVRRAPQANATWLEVRGAAEHNLKNLDVRIPLGRLVCITGVSGSGKSTLVEDILYRALLKSLGKPSEAPGAFAELRGADALGEVVLVDQAPIGKTARSNPASYVGAFDAVRQLFTTDALARERRYTVGTFSFNAGSGRCPGCGGSGFEHVEMQFLSDVYLRCPDCGGRRFRSEVLEVKLERGTRRASIADVLEMTVAEAAEFFAGDPEVLAGLEPLQAVGLGYIRLGQPVPTLSGGEAQRLKLAGHLAQAGSKTSAKPTLFLFDEPTTGLHFSDIAVLFGAFDTLLARGHSLVVIEHNLDVIAAADWIIDLGPEGGDEGGRLVCAETPDEVMRHADSYTGQALREYAEAATHGTKTVKSPLIFASPPMGRRDDECEPVISIHNAREHNLCNLDVTIPRGRFTVVTGVSGSGKSTLAFDILFAEGQRRYLESLNAYARQFVEPAARAEVDEIRGIPPTVAIEQRTSRGGRKSTVATLTEIYHFLRLLFVKLGVQYCPDCNLAIEAQSAEMILARLLREYRGRELTLLAPLVVARKGYYTELAKWAHNKGYAQLRVDGKLTKTDTWPRLSRFQEHNIELPLATLKVAAHGEHELRELLARALDYGKGVVQVLVKDAEPQLFSIRRNCPGCGRSFPELDPRLFSYNSRHGWCKTCYGTGLVLPGFDADSSGEEIWWNEWWEGGERPCPDCEGRRLNPVALAVRFAGRNIAQLAALSVDEAQAFFDTLKLNGRAAEIARDVLPEIITRLKFLKEVGLNYLVLDRAAPTLSGGEAQRIRLAAQLGSNLRGVCYILDEPSIGLHARDNARLLTTLARLRDKGNTVVVVEHDEDTMAVADNIVDLGPGAGRNGGRLVAAGTLAQIRRNPESVTGRYLLHPLRHDADAHRPVRRSDPVLRIRHADLHNLKQLDTAIPLGRFTCVTGVSGSGKSTLVREVLHDNLHMLLAARGRKPKLRGCRAIEGAAVLGRVLEVDQTPIGKTPRSCPATYIGIWDTIRRLFADVPEARLRGWGAGRFSFNTSGGRCAACEGQGMKRVEMNFLPDVRVRCEVCNGARFNSETLAVRWRGKTIAEVLAMTVTEAVEFFRVQPHVHRTLELLEQVGLGYLTLGQQSPTLSGGEAQRIKLVTELAKAAPALQRQRAKPTLYVLDEPTVGLHMADVEKLIAVLHRLVEAGHTLVVIEHNLDVIAEADWVIDLGPEGGAAGGRIVASGPPLTVAQRASHTGRVLKPFLTARAA